MLSKLTRLFRSTIHQPVKRPRLGLEAFEDRIVPASVVILDNVAMTSANTTGLLSGDVDTSLSNPTVTGSIDAQGNAIPPTEVISGVSGGNVSAIVISTDPLNGGVVAVGQSSTFMQLMAQPDTGLNAGKLTFLMTPSVSCQLGEAGQVASASYSGGSGAGHDDSVLLNIAAGAGETDGTPVSVVLTATATGDSGTFDFGYTPADSDRLSLLQGTSSGSSASKSVTLSAKLGDTLSVDFFADGSGSGADQATQVLNYTIEVKPLVAQSDLVAGALQWKPTNPGAKFTYQVTGANLQQDSTVAFYWATGPNYADRVGNALFTAPVQKQVGEHTVTVPGSDLVNLPYSVSPTPQLLATRLIAVLDPDNVVPETNEGNNVGSLTLAPVSLGADFITSFTRSDGQIYTLNPQLLDQVMQLVSYTVAQNLVDSVLINEGLRDPAKAHRWSTAWSIRHDRVPLSALRALPGGKDKDGNLWYDPAWEVGLPKKANGQLTPKGRDMLWAKIKANAAVVDGRKNPDAIAAEGYAVDDPFHAPNTYTKVSNHCIGLAMDVRFKWRAGAKVNGQAITDGSQTDAVVNDLIKTFGLKRPVKGNPDKGVKPEPWHFELLNPQ